MMVPNKRGPDNTNDHYVHCKCTKERWSLLVYGHVHLKREKKFVQLRVLWLSNISIYHLLYAICQSTPIEVCMPKNPPLLTMCIFYKAFASFWFLTCENLHIYKLHVNFVTCEEKNNTSIDTLEIEITRTIKHVTLTWTFIRKCRC